MAGSKLSRVREKPRRSSAPPRPGSTSRLAPREESFALVDRVYEEIREAIREGSIKPGYRLVERDIAAQLNVSRTPVREALRLLEAHGLASSVTGRGLVVTSLTPGEIVELYHAWEMIEGVAAATAAQNATNLEIDALRQIHSLWNPEDTARNLGRLNKRFHLAIHVATHNRFLIRASRIIDDSVSLLGFSTYSLPRRGHEVAAEHGAILEAIAARNPTAAAAAAHAHIRRAGQLRMAASTEGAEIHATADDYAQASRMDWR
ncbi:transcriptional regulator, GntR family [Bradyrhizobium canariense]|uniref:Transcriptional regulator, GntR family n=2 Tax=Bradyrhizobium canariense TaxID=255045 RepID=A0A1H2B4Y7_9BRAD|nr:transcriptional regulator, GntR family [Bradyrhizobium canariense]